MRLNAKNLLRDSSNGFVSLGSRLAKATPYSNSQAFLFGKTGQRGACIPIEYPMTKSDAVLEKEGHMTRKF